MMSCQSEFDKLLNGYDTQAKMDAAFDYYEKGKYNKAAQLFESLTMTTKGTPQDDTVQFYLGMSNYKFKDYVTAESNFQQFVSVFPVSPFTEKAQFLRIDCLFRGTYRYELDQTPTRKALYAIDIFNRERPNSEYNEVCIKMKEDLEERLDKKAFESAKLYYHMEDYLAARYALKNVLKDDADNCYREEIMYLIAKSSYLFALNSIAERQYDRYLNFVDDYYNFASEYPESSHKSELDKLYNKVNNIIKK